MCHFCRIRVVMLNTLKEREIMSICTNLWISEIEKNINLIEALKSKDINKLLNTLGCSISNTFNISWTLTRSSDSEVEKQYYLEIESDSPQELAEKLLRYLVCECGDKNASLRYMVDGGAPDFDIGDEDAVENYKNYLASKGYDMDGFYDAIYGESIFATFVTVDDKGNLVKEHLPL